MSTTPRARLPYKPAVDGIRGLAVAAVLLFHSDFTWAKGGFLGVTTFFVLSGFLITSLLLVERNRTATISLRPFWARRARRLVPAVLLLVGLVVLYVWTASAKQPSGLLGDAAATLGWVANW